MSDEPLDARPWPSWKKWMWVAMLAPIGLAGLVILLWPLVLFLLTMM